MLSTFINVPHEIYMLNCNYKYACARVCVVKNYFHYDIIHALPCDQNQQPCHNQMQWGVFMMTYSALQSLIQKNIF